jgi:hypothetical protein
VYVGVVEDEVGWKQRLPDCGKRTQVDGKAQLLRHIQKQDTLSTGAAESGY